MRKILSTPKISFKNKIGTRNRYSVISRAGREQMKSITLEKLENIRPQKDLKITPAPFIIQKKSQRPKINRRRNLSLEPPKKTAEIFLTNYFKENKAKIREYQIDYIKDMLEDNFHDSSVENTQRSIPEKYVGKKALQEYYKKYQKFNRYSDRIEDSPVKKYMSRLHDSNLPAIAIPMIKRRGSQEEMNLKNLHLGKQYISALSSSMQGLDLKNVIVSGVKNNEQGISEMFENLPKGVQSLDASSSSIGLQSLDNLYFWLSKGYKKSSLKLRHLNLSNNKITDSLGERFFTKMISIDTNIKALNLSKNLIGNKTITKMAEWIEGNPSLKVLNLSWNRIGESGAVEFLSAICTLTLRDLNLAYNRIGLGGSTLAVEALLKLINEGYLRHLDISYTNLDQQQCKIFGEGIKENHTLFGLHMQGNQCYIDSHGFLRQDVQAHITKYCDSSLMFPHSVNGHSSVVSLKSKGQFVYETKCWICEGWSEKTFVIKNGRSMINLSDPVYIHFKFNNYEAEFMKKVPNSSTGLASYEYTCMVPPGRINYFFSSNKYPYFARDHPIQRERLIATDIQVYDTKKSFIMSKYNYDCIDQSPVLDDNYQSVLKECYPRKKKEVYVPIDHGVERPPWKFEESVFAHYQPETQDLIDQIFECDWSMISSKKFKIPEEGIAVKQILKENYWKILEIYRYQSAIGTTIGSSCFSISLNQFTEFVKSTGILGMKGINQSEIDTIFIILNKRYKKTELNPGNAVIRFQFLEALLKLSQRKAFNSVKAIEIIRDFIENCVIPTHKQPIAQEWREERYWNEFVDNVYKAHEDLFKEVYRAYSGSKSLPGQARFMDATEFDNIFSDSCLQNERISNREVNACFSLAMQSQIDEIKSARFMQMNYIEFLEGLARLADIISLPPPSEEYKMKFQTLLETKKTVRGSSSIRPKAEEISEEDEEEKNFYGMSLVDRISQPLHKKIENILPNLLLNCTTNRFKKQWVWPTKHPDYDLYENKNYKVNVIQKIISKNISKTFFQMLGIEKIVKEAVRRKREQLHTSLAFIST
ncbi:unnamed protein product [Moneuplotes crassus]|uniref:Leucine Rich Repeat family protein n=1 Tax=Euplotes crassus TaxID=5936 RepID=A0AAD1XHS9_EUPCR|nr:unnamed protein product [Moneuplotes crassus]